MKRKNILLTVIGAAAAAACFWAAQFGTDRYAGNFSDRYVLYVRPGMEAESVLDSLELHAGTKRRGSMRRCARSEGLAERMKPGKYTVAPEHSAMYTVRMLCNGWQTPQNLTLSGTIRTRSRIADIISRQMMADSLQIDSLLHSNEFLARFGTDTLQVFSLILPDTYQMYWTASPEAIFGRFRKEYDIFWDDRRMASAEELGLTPQEVSVLASIVCGETLRKDEYPVIAGVYLNRLRRGMRLQADPTIAYCFDYKPDRILKRHLQVDSPYNTYKYAGLPPSPINVPNKACIDAVLNPARHNYLYFCASPELDGTHRFASSYSEHLRNARAFQRALSAR